ncbi:hypothetical protein ACFX1W_014306 [Malus domestica]
MFNLFTVDGNRRVQPHALAQRHVGVHHLPAANSDDAVSLISFKISCSTCGFCESSQKNQVRAAEVVSRPMRVKLMMMSVTNFSSE